LIPLCCIRHDIVINFSAHLLIPEQQQILNQYWQEYLRLFRVETQALGKLGEEYQQIPTIFEYFDEQDEYFYVQEYTEGHS
jgi:serine/threonine-protein kinase